MSSRPSPAAAILSGFKRVSALTGLSRLLGFVRDVLAAYLFGASAVWDAFVMAFTLPNTFRRIFGEGAFTSAFLPLLSEQRAKEGDRGAVQYAAYILSNLVAALMLVMAVGFVILVLAGYGLGFVETEALLVRYSFLMWPYLVLVCLTGALGAVLNAYKQFSIPALSSSVMNVCWLGALALIWWVKPEMATGGYWMCLAILISGVCQLGLHYTAFRRLGGKLKMQWHDDGLTRSVMRRMAPAFLGVAAVQLNTLVDQWLAKWLVEGDGGVSVLYYGNRLMQLPLALIGISLATVVFTYLSDAAAAKDTSQVTRRVHMGLFWALGLSLPVSLFGVVFSEQIVSLVLQRGAFDAQSAQRVVLTLQFYLSGLIFFCANQVLSRLFHAVGDLARPARITGAMVALNFGLNVLLVRVWNEAGLALSTAICAGITTIIYVVKLRTCHQIRLRMPVSRWLLLASAGAAGVGASYGLFQGLGESIGGSGWQAWLRFGVSLVIPGVIYYLGLRKVYRAWQNEC